MQITCTPCDHKTLALLLWDILSLSDGPVSSLRLIMELGILLASRVSYWKCGVDATTSRFILVWTVEILLGTLLHKVERRWDWMLNAHLASYQCLEFRRALRKRPTFLVKSNININDVGQSRKESGIFPEKECFSAAYDLFTHLVFTFEKVLPLYSLGCSNSIDWIV